MKYILKGIVSACILLQATACFMGCTAEKKSKYIIGVSQCSADIWREKQNSELRMGAYLNGDVELRFAAAYDSDERQVQQIDSLVDTGIDLLIVAPNQVQTISPAIDRAYDSGLPIIVFERKTSSQKYTAFISADNYEMGRTMGDFVAAQLGGHGRVIEVTGLQGSSPAIERHKGFVDALKSHPGIGIVATLQGDWTEQSAYEATKHWLADKDTDLSEGIDFVFGQNDRMAMGTRKAMLEDSRFLALQASNGRTGGKAPKFCGIDGLPGDGGGIRLVADSVLEATYIYPTHGDRLLELAVSILNGEPYEKESLLKSALVTKENARVLLMQSEEIMRQSDYLDRLHRRADNYLQQLSTQRTITLLACGLIGLLLLVMVLFYLYHRGQITLQRERVVNNLWNLEGQTEPLKPQPQPHTEEKVAVAVTIETSSEASPAPTPQETSTQDTSTQEKEAVEVAEASSSHFISRFKDAVEARLSDSELSVEDLAADMNLSRVQLYRKVKSISGSSPVELLRTARLNRGYQLLLTTDKSISEVAYAVGFTAPSYFTKCFKEEFGQSPTDMR